MSFIFQTFGATESCDGVLGTVIVVRLTGATCVWYRKVRRCFGTVIWCDSKVHHFFGGHLVRLTGATFVWYGHVVRLKGAPVFWYGHVVRLKGATVFCYGHLVRLQAATLRLLRSFAATQGCDSWLGTTNVRRSFGTVMWLKDAVSCYGHLVRLTGATCVWYGHVVRLKGATLVW